MADMFKSKGTAGNSSPVQQWIDWFFRPAMLVRLSIVAGVCALWPYAAQRLPSLDKRAEYRLAFQKIRIVPVPSRPVPLDLVDQVQKLSEAPDEVSILEQSLTSEVANAFRHHPWVAKVVRVRKSFPAAVMVELEYRQPVAMVQVPGGRLPVDINGVVLPTGDFSPDEAIRYPLIQNVSSKPVAPGTAWDDPALVAAARLANLLGEQWKTLKLEAIVVPRHATTTTAANDIPLELSGRGGSRIIWGRPPGSDHPGELEPSQKIRRLEKYLADFGDYGKPNGPYEIDIRHWQEISRRPMAVEQVNAKPVKNPKEDSKKQISEGKKKTRS